MFSKLALPVSGMLMAQPLAAVSEEPPSPRATASFFSLSSRLQAKPSEDRPSDWLRRVRFFLQHTHSKPGKTKT